MLRLIIMAAFDSNLAVYNSAYTKLITLSSALLVTPELAIDITPETAIIKQNRTNNYEVLKGNAYNYIFAYNQTLDNWNANLSENQLIISHDIISADYGIPITDPENGQPYAVGYYLNNPELQDIRPLQAPITGLPFGDYIREINDAIQIIVDDCGVDMNLIDDNQEVFYQSIYPFPNVVTGVVTNKTSMISVMKYSVGDIKYVLYWGTGIKSTNIPPTSASYSAVSTAQSKLTYSINPDPATYLAAAQASASASASYNGADADLNASTEATNLANSISTEEAEKAVLNYVTSSVSPNITIIQFQNSTECTTTPI